MKKTPCLLASACLCGAPCRYDGRAAPHPELVRLYEQGLALPVCPEVDGGLPAPRPPCELRGGRAVSKDGRDVTERVLAGAEQALELARRYNLRLAVLKERSPACGGKRIYDGTFSGRVIAGQGLAAALLDVNGVTVINEDECASALDLLPGENR
jgi:D-alanine-D-alanine ligase